MSKSQLFLAGFIDWAKEPVNLKKSFLIESFEFYNLQIFLIKIKNFSELIAVLFSLRIFGKSWSHFFIPPDEIFDRFIFSFFFRHTKGENLRIFIRREKKWDWNSLCIWSEFYSMIGSQWAAVWNNFHSATSVDNENITPGHYVYPNFVTRPLNFRIWVNFVQILGKF